VVQTEARELQARMQHSILLLAPALKRHSRESGNSAPGTIPSMLNDRIPYIGRFALLPKH
jgi:hypothetical protein